MEEKDSDITQEIAVINEEMPAGPEEAETERSSGGNEDVEMDNTQEIAVTNEKKAAGPEEAETERSSGGNKDFEMDSIKKIADTDVQKPIAEDEAETEPSTREEQDHRSEFFKMQKLSLQRLSIHEPIANYSEDLMYGTPIQIQSNVKVFRCAMHIQISLSIIDFLHDIDFIKNWPEPLVSVSVTNTCVRRNIFTCLSAQGKEPNTPVLYGDDFFIRLYYNVGPELYLSGNFNRVNDLGKVPVCLTDEPDVLSIFHIVDRDPSRRYDLLGTPVKNFMPVCIAQTFSSQLLTADMRGETDLFREHPVVCDTYDEDVFDITSRNLFIFKTKENVLKSNTDSDGQDHSGNEACGTSSHL